MEPRLRIRYYSDESSVWLDELSALLRAIEVTGSLNRAAQRIGVPYRRAWQVLRDATELLGYPLTSTATGGTEGGGSTLTDPARILGKLLEDLELRLGTEGSRLRLPSATAPPRRGDLGLPPEPELLLACSTEPVESGLLDNLEAAFFEESGIRVRHLSVGSGEALALVVNGRADAAITHAPALEAKLHRRGLAGKIHPFMMSHFVVVAPRKDPAHLDELTGNSLLDYFSRIEASETPFVSRADRSGTHLRELDVWKRLDGTVPRGSWYHAETAVAGTGQAIKSAIAAGGYTLADRLAIRKVRGLRLFKAVDDSSRNIYSLVIPAVSTPGRSAADFFSSWLSSPRARALLESAGVTPI